DKVMLATFADRRVGSSAKRGRPREGKLYSAVEWNIVIDDFSARILKELVGVDPKHLEFSAAKPEQQNAADHWTRPILMERAAYLGKLARYGEGSASETIKDYPQHSVMLSVRRRNSDPEMHEKVAHIYMVLDGSAALVTGGTKAGVAEIRGGQCC